MEFIEYLQKGLLESAVEWMDPYPELPQAESLSGMESAVRDMTSQLGQMVLGAWLTQQDPKYAAETIACSCGKQADYERRREATTITLQGRVSYRCGCCPLAEALGIQPGQMSEQLRKVAARFGISEAYAPSAEALAAVTGVSLSPNSVRQACLDLGHQVVEVETRLVAQSQALTEHLRQRREGPPPERL